MISPKERPTCPHCGTQLSAFMLPEDAGYSSAVHLACFNNECSYYRDGWAWMDEKYAAHASYRYRVDPLTGIASPLAVWSETALVDKIVDPGKKV